MRTDVYISLLDDHHGTIDLNNDVINGLPGLS